MQFSQADFRQPPVSVIVISRPDGQPGDTALSGIPVDKVGQWYTDLSNKVGQWYTDPSDKVGQWYTDVLICLSVIDTRFTVLNQCIMCKHLYSIQPVYCMLTPVQY